MSKVWLSCGRRKPFKLEILILRRRKLLNILGLVRSLGIKKDANVLRGAHEFFPTNFGGGGSESENGPK